MFKSKNLNYVYNVEYYDGVNFLDSKNAAFTEKNKELLTISSKAPSLDGVYTHSFSLKTTYPGLIAGIGPLHEIGAKDEFSLGFNFDYVTGVFCIPGSTVKGILKSAFKNSDVICDLLGKPELDVNSFMKHLFEGEKPNGTLVKSIERDIFFDAYPIDNQGSILDEDYITPHGKDLTKNPIPIKFLKIKPNVSFKFCFKLFDYKIGDEICVSAAEKCELFKKLIKLLGMGAKTNVGYGELVDATRKDLKSATQVDPQQNNYGNRGGFSRSNNGYNNQRNNGYNGYNQRKNNTAPAQETKPCKKCGAPIPKNGGNYCSKCYAEYKKEPGQLIKELWR